MTIGYGRGFVELTYTALAQTLGRNWRTIARSVRVLRQHGDVMIESLRDGSYRWWVLLEPEDIRSDPEGIYRMRDSEDGIEHPLNSMPPHDKNAMAPMTKRPWGHDGNVIPLMTKMSWGHPLSREDGNVDKTTLPVCFPQPENGALKIILKDIDLKKQQQKKTEATEAL